MQEQSIEIQKANTLIQKVNEHISSSSDTQFYPSFGDRVNSFLEIYGSHLVGTKQLDSLKELQFKLPNQKINAKQLSALDTELVNVRAADSRFWGSVIGIRVGHVVSEEFVPYFSKRDRRLETYNLFCQENNLIFPSLIKYVYLEIEDPHADSMKLDIDSSAMFSFPLSERVRTILHRNKIHTIGELVSMPKNNLSKIGIGQRTRAMEQINFELNRYGLRLMMSQTEIDKYFSK